jgi:hypothetical protein
MEHAGSEFSMLGISDRSELVSVRSLPHPLRTDRLGPPVTLEGFGRVVKVWGAPADYAPRVQKARHQEEKLDLPVADGITTLSLPRGRKVKWKVDDPKTTHAEYSKDGTRVLGWSGSRLHYAGKNSEWLSPVANIGVVLDAVFGPGPRQITLVSEGDVMVLREEGTGWSTDVWRKTCPGCRLVHGLRGGGSSETDEVVVVSDFWTHRIFVGGWHPLSWSYDAWPTIRSTFHDNMVEMVNPEKLPATAEGPAADEPAPSIEHRFLSMWN